MTLVGDLLASIHSVLLQALRIAPARVLVGAPGSGKTALLRIQLGLDSLDEGPGEVATSRGGVP